MPETPDTIVFIHGLWMTPRSWEKWAARYQSRGYTTLAPAWPGLDAEVEALRSDPEPLKELSVERILDHYQRIIGDLDTRPIVIGHSLGGTIMQLILDRGLGAAGVGVAPATVRGIRDLPLAALRSSFPVLRNPFGSGNASPLSRRQFQFAFGNTLTQAESDEVYDRYYVPAANRVLFQVVSANLNPKTSVRVDFGNDRRAPLLMIAFGEDHVVPPKPIRHNAERYETRSPTAFKEFPGRPHFPAAPGWEEVADYALSWATEHAMRAPAASAATH